MFGNLPGEFEIVTVAEQAGPVTSVQKVSLVADHSFETCPRGEFVLLPGGMGTFAEGRNPAMLEFLRRSCSDADQVMTVCSGSGLLARTGLLNERQATTNKAYFPACSAEGPEVHWVKEARWVEDGPFATSSGVSAGIDMALAVISRHLGADTADRLALMAEYEWHRDSAWDPFAKRHGLV